MEYYICSTSVFDNIHFKEKESVLSVPGGAGIYALAGAKLWADNVNLVCGVGTDYRDKMENWYKRNDISMETIRVVDDLTPVNDIHYDSEKERVETPELGKNHYRKFETQPEEFLNLVSKKDTGIYVFRNTEDKFWSKFKKIDKKKAFILWEIAADACQPDEIQNIKEILQKIDVFSLNFEEAKALFNTDNYEKIVKNLYNFNVPVVFLRLGKYGQVFLINGKKYFVSSISTDVVQDVTGGGNSSSGAVLVGASQGKSAEEMGEMANKSAIMSLAQQGIPQKIKNNTLFKENKNEIKRKKF